MQVNSERIRLEPQADYALRPPASGQCFLPTVRQLDLRYLPIWNESVLRAEWRQQRMQERAYKADCGLLTHKQLSDSRSWLTTRSMAGPIPRAQVAAAMGVSLQVVQQIAKKHGFWLRATENEMGQNPFQQLMFRLFADFGDAPLWFDFDDEIQADAKAQQEVEQLRSRIDKPPAVPDQIGIWKVTSDPFLAVEAEHGLSWWVEHECAVPGCKHRRSRWRPLKTLKRSTAQQCQQHAMPGFVDLNDLMEAGDAFTRMRRRHVPALLYGTPELTHPDMAQGVLADYNRMLENPPGLKEPEPAPAPDLQLTTSLYFTDTLPPLPEVDPEALLLPW